MSEQPRTTDEETDSPAPAEDAVTPSETAVGSRRRRRALSIASAAVVALLGAIVGILLVPATPVDVGPLKAAVHLRPSLHSQTAILLPPVGEVVFDTHSAPVRVEARVRTVDIAKAQELFDHPEGLKDLERTAPDAISRAVVLNTVLNTLGAAGGAGIAVALTFRRVRRSLISAGVATAVVLGTATGAYLTFAPQSLKQPRFDGLLSQAAYIADLGQGKAVDYASYRKTLAEFVSQVSALYIAADSLPVGYAREDLITVLHVSDFHSNPQSYDVIEQISSQFDIDMVIDTGDIISWGTPWENDMVTAISKIDAPYVFIKGNHDGEATAAKVAEQPNAIVLDNSVATVEGLTIAGIADPRYAADDDSDAGGWREGDRAVAASGFQLGETIDAYNAEHSDAPVNVALFHDPTQPNGLLGRVDLVLSGHMHRSIIELDREGSGTDWLTVGSTGGALASGGVMPVLDGEQPLELAARMLYFDRTTKRLVFYDDIVMGGLGLVSVSVNRHQMPTEETPLRRPDDAVAPDSPIDQEEGESVPDSERVTPPNPQSPLPPSDGGGATPTPSRKQPTPSEDSET